MKKDVLLILFFIAVILYTGFSIYKILNTSAPDFPSYYFATKDLIEHKNPYLDKNIPNIFIYPAVTSIFYLPFILLPYLFAQGIFVLLSAFSVPAIVFICIKLIYKKFLWREFIFFTSFTFLAFPTKFTLGMGQVNLIALLFLMTGFYFYTKHNIKTSSILFGISFLAKPILSFIILLFVLNKDWKALLLIMSTLVSFFVIAFILFGSTHEIFYITSLVPSLVGGTEGREVYYNQGIMGFVSRLSAESSVRTYASVLLSLLMLGISYFVIKRKKMDTGIVFAVLLTLLPIVHTLSWQHYFVILIFPFILTVKKIFDKKRYKLFIPLVIAYVLISWNFKNPSEYASLPSILLLSHVLYGAIILWVILLHFKRQENKKK